MSTKTMERELVIHDDNDRLSPGSDWGDLTSEVIGSKSEWSREDAIVIGVYTAGLLLQHEDNGLDKRGFYFTASRFANAAEPPINANNNAFQHFTTGMQRAVEMHTGKQLNPA